MPAVKGGPGVRYIKAVMPMKDFRLYMEMEGGSTATVDFSNKLHTAKFAELKDETIFRSAITDGDYVIWGGGRIRLTVNELMEVILLG